MEDLNWWNWLIILGFGVLVLNAFSDFFGWINDLFHPNVKREKAQADAIRARNSVSRIEDLQEKFQSAKQAIDNLDLTSEERERFCADIKVAAAERSTRELVKVYDRLRRDNKVEDKEYSAAAYKAMAEAFNDLIEPMEEAECAIESLDDLI